ncbi:hypothetical protein AB0D42_36340 [Streptomyces sp. NPDC048304]|uniref:hypothetical protein n=1 Tax=Streptomyces sp. NPDC048304 TaxID=3154820 RepID=UPI0033C0C7DB
MSSAAAPPATPAAPRVPYAQPWKWVLCPHACGYVGKPEIRPSVLYALVPQLSPQ